MSRVGKKPIEIPAGVTVLINGKEITVKGPKGELKHTVNPEITVTQENGVINITAELDCKETGALWGLARALLANMIIGVTEGFEKKLELVGVGYRTSAAGKGLTLALGYSHAINFPAPEGINLSVEENKTITVSGIDKQLVGQTAAKIRAFRKPEVYKGKGVKYVGEIVKTKPGKSGKV